MFVTESDFDAIPYNIVQSSDAPNALDSFIPFKEKEILRMLLGSVTYDEFVHALFVNPDALPLVPIAENLIAQKWKDLRDGADYETGSKNYRYNGVRDFLIPFICSEWIDQQATFQTSVGNTVAVVENSERISSAIPVVVFWMDFYNKIGGIRCFGYRDSFFGFMSSRYTVDYVDWVFEDPGVKNEFDL